VLSCISIPNEEADADELGADPLAWSSLVEAIEAHARAQPAEARRELREWADLVAGMAELQGRHKD